MEVVKKRRASDILLGFYLLSHPGPVFIHILGVTVFTLLAAWPRLLWGTIVLVIAAHAAMQIRQFRRRDDSGSGGGGPLDDGRDAGIVAPTQSTGFVDIAALSHSGSGI